MKRLATVAVLTMLATLVPAGLARADHVPTELGPHVGLTADQPVLKHGPVRFVTNLPVARGVAAPLGDHDKAVFTRDGRRYMAISSTVYGLHVLDVTNPLAPVAVSDYASAAGCPSALAEYLAAHSPALAKNPFAVFNIAIDGALGLTGWENDVSVTPDGTIAVIGMDAGGRCHDPDYGGLEFVDLTDLKRPRTLHLTRNVGLAHSVGIDPAKPWLAYISTSDGSDFIDIVDFRSCLGGVAQIDRCRPTVARADFSTKTPGIPRNPDDPSRDLVAEGCHDTRFRAGRLYCAALDATIIFDISGVVGAGGELTGTHLDCPLDSAGVLARGVMATDCSAWTKSKFTADNARSVTIEAVSTILHDGSKPPTEDISIAHQAEAIEDGKVMLVTDERGGGLGVGPRRACPDGGIWFYDIRNESKPLLMKTPDGNSAVFRTDKFQQTFASCTAHYGTQVPGERLLTFAWYTGGSHLVRYDIDYSKSPAEITFEEVATYIPSGAWTTQNMPMGRNPANPDELIVYAADATRGLDVLAFNVPRAGDASDDTGAKVLGNQFNRRVLATTGVADTTALGLILVFAAAAVARRARTRTSRP
ncbi:MAG TPA: hypothetical protein VM600_00810 [Actinomycetota bacterium]|nr:hypothetical protein [Actinomycetota bacterium]